VNWSVRGRQEEPEMSQPGEPVMHMFYESAENYPVVGDSVEAVVDGESMRLPLVPAAGLPGATKAVVVLPNDGLPHTVVLCPVYDLGPGGKVRVTDTRESDGHGFAVYTFESPVDKVVMKLGCKGDMEHRACIPSRPAQLKLKD